MYDPCSPRADEFIDHEEVMASLAYADHNRSDRGLVQSILEKARQYRGLGHREALVLLDSAFEDSNRETLELAEKIKQDFYGNRIVMFAPLYLSNHCVNGCVYCPYHMSNTRMPRVKLSQEEIRREAVALQDMGHKRLAIESGEHPVHNPIEYILESIETIYNTRHKNGAIRRANVNIAATTVENYRRLRDAGIGTYILFQETYNRKRYESLHPSGPKSDYTYHTEAMDRAMQGGIDDVGLGVLFGLEQYRYEFVALLMHAEHLEALYGVGPHTISVPRIRPAEGVDPEAFDNGIVDDAFAKLVACLRVAMPYAGIIMSTRESKACREKIIRYGVSQISGGSKTSVGGYHSPIGAAAGMTENSEQFEVSDNRPLDEVVRWLMETGHIPSFCTACYREGRTGDRFMKLCKDRQIHNCCQPNALMTLKEYLEDYASDETRRLGEELIEREIGRIPKEEVRKIVRHNLSQIAGGLRDFRL